MRHFFSPLFLLLFISVIVIAGQNSQEIIHLIRGGISDETMRAWIETQHDFKLTEQEIEELRQAGASTELIGWLQSTGRVSQESVLEKEPEHPSPTETSDPSQSSSAPIEVPSFSVEVQLVNIIATVGDKKGNPVRGLNRDDFLVYEDGKLQQITNFSAEEKPMSVGILLDISGSMEEKLEPARDALKHFINILHPDDEFFLYTFNDDVQFVQDFTSDRRRLSAAMESLYAIGGTALYDVLIKGLQKISQGARERKAIVLISDGMDTTSDSDFEKVLYWARRAEVPIYSIGLGHEKGFFSSLFKHQDHQEEDFDPRTLTALSAETGGQPKLLANLAHHHEGKVDHIDEAVKELAVWLKYQYDFAYTPLNDKKDGTWREIKVETKRKELKVNARKGYYAPAS